MNNVCEHLGFLPGQHSHLDTKYIHFANTKYINFLRIYNLCLNKITMFVCVSVRPIIFYFFKFNKFIIKDYCWYLRMRWL